MATPLVPERGCCEDLPAGIIITPVRHGKQKQELRRSRRCMQGQSRSEITSQGRELKDPQNFA